MKKKSLKNKGKDELRKTFSPVKISIEKEVQDSYLNYAMSVIVSRALPDIRDGLKPVQRRILYAMWRMGLKAGAKNRKSAAVVGETLAKFHPHGDSAVYSALARMVQNFSLRYPLIDGQGNWGSIDGDPPAAQRYTECRLSKIAEEMLGDIEKQVVAFSPNYDGTLPEPQVLPARLPNLLLNGTMGIAVGMATNIPPHNLKETASAIIYLIDHPAADLERLFKILPGPDFPTGGLIFDSEEIKQAYALGKGSIVIRAKTEILEIESGSWQIVVSELPYQVNKAELLQTIARLKKEKRIEEIKSIRDESDKQGIRVVIELKKGTIPQKVQNLLFKLTNLETCFYVNLVALVDGRQPRLLDLKTMLQEYIKHRQAVIKKRTQFDLTKTNERLHIIAGLKIALDHIDEIIKTIKRSKDKEEAKRTLITHYHLSEIQAMAILEMRLHELSRLERNKVEGEIKDKLKLKRSLEEILAEPKKILLLIKEELKAGIEKYGDERKTMIIDQPLIGFKEEDLIPDKPILVGLTRGGYIKRFSPEIFRAQARGGKGMTGFETKEQDLVTELISTTNHSDLFFFTDRGRVFRIKTYQIPEVSRISRGQALANFLPLNLEEKVTCSLARPLKKEAKFFGLVTRTGMIKKIKAEDFSKIRQTGLSVIKLKKGDKVIAVRILNEGDEIVLVTSLGQSLRFKEKDLRVMARNSYGVRGIKLKKEDQVIGADIVRFQISKDKSQNYLLVLTESGFGKLSRLENYRLQHRAGSGIKTGRVNEKTGKLKSIMVLNWSNLPFYFKGDLLIITNTGQVIRFFLKEIPVLSRSTQGVRVIRFKDPKDKVASAVIV